LANTKKDYDRALTRMTDVLRRLNEGETLSIKDLAQEYNVSTRTIQRDINDRLYSYPIEKVGKKFRFAEGYRVEKSHSLEDELILDVLERICENIGTTFSIRAKTLLNKMKNSSSNTIFAKLFLEDISEKLDEVALLEKAIEQKRAISCRYDFGSYAITIDIEPLKIVSFEGFWYLLARDYRNKATKKYYLKSITDIAFKDEYFSVSPELKERLHNAINVWFDADIEPYRVRLYIDAEVAKYFKRKPIAKNQIISSVYDDGSIEITIKITHDNEISYEILKWMPHIKVIEPLSLKEYIEGLLKEWLKV